MKSLKCSECGLVGWADAEFCKRCGAALTPDAAGSADQTQPGDRNTWSDGAGRSHGDIKKGLAITSLVIGIAGFFSFGIMLIGAIVGTTLGIVALVKANRYPSKYGGKGLATAGVVVNVLSVVAIVPFGIIAAIAIPNLLASARAANEGSTIAVMRRVTEAEATYRGQHGTYGTLNDLAVDQLIEPEIASGERHGYKFAVNGSPDARAYEAVALPVAYPTSGFRSFYVNETGVIRAADHHGTAATKYDSPFDSYSSSSGSQNSRRYNSDSGY